MSPEALFFVIGLAASLPLSILANLVTKRLERWWAGRNEREAEELAQRDAEFRALVHRFAADDIAYRDWLWEKAWRAARGLATLILEIITVVMAIGALNVMASIDAAREISVVVLVLLAVVLLLTTVTHYQTTTVIAEATTMVRIVANHRRS